MIKPDQIPDEVVEAAKITYTAEIYKGQATAREYDAAMRAAIVALINAWPGMVCYPPDLLDEVVNPERIILPLPQEGVKA